MNIDVTFIGHSGYFVKAEKCGFLFDYYTGLLPMDDIAACERLYVFASHSHYDHFNKAVFDIPFEGRRKFILSSDIPVTGRNDIVSMPPYYRYSDDDLRITSFGSTDMGVSFLLETGGLSIFHAGDLNLWSWRAESTPKEIADAAAMFARELDIIKAEISHIDLAFFPVDPRLKVDYDEGARIFAQRFSPDILYAMHYSDAQAVKDTFGNWAKNKSGLTAFIPDAPLQKQSFEIVPYGKEDKQ